MLRAAAWTMRAPPPGYGGPPLLVDEDVDEAEVDRLFPCGYVDDVGDERHECFAMRAGPCLTPAAHMDSATACGASASRTNAPCA